MLGKLAVIIMDFRKNRSAFKRGVPSSAAAILYFTPKLDLAFKLATLLAAI